MTKLHQILAIERGAKQDADRDVGIAVRGLGVEGEQSPLTGLVKTYEPRDEGGDELPGEYRHVQIRAERDVLPSIARAMTRHLDVKFTREAASAQAKADIRVDGRVLVPDVPVGYLLGLEESLENLAALVKKLPALDPSEEWHWDEARGCYATEPKQTARKLRVPQVQVLQQPQVIDGKAFEGQYRPYETEVPVGNWTTVKLSGALPFDTIQAVYRRVRKVADAVKMAREHANSIDVTDRKAGEALFEYILGDAVLHSDGSAASAS
jgi:hypothetical protein